MATYEKELIEIRRANNCTFVRSGKGDHQIWFSPISNRHFAVDSKIKSRHTANGVLKQAGLNKHF